MRKLLLITLASCTAPALSAQDAIPQVQWYEIEGDRFYEAKGCPPGSSVAFYSERCGGRLLKTVTVEANGGVVVEAEEDFRPAFAHNNGLGGSRKTSFYEAKAFSLKDIELYGFQDRVTLQWKATVGDYPDYEFEVLERAVGKNGFVVVETFPASPGQLAPYVFPTSGGEGNTYKIRLRDKRSGWSFTSQPMAVASTSWKVYPTLAKDYIHVLVNATEIGSDYRIVDISGKVMVTGVLENKLTAIPVMELASGNYFIQLLRQGLAAPSQKFIKP